MWNRWRAALSSERVCAVSHLGYLRPADSAGYEMVTPLAFLGMMLRQLRMSSPPNLTANPTPYDIPPAVAVLTLVACLVPFLWKPFHIDDPIFIWTAQHVAEHPLDFYGFPVNWHGTVTSIADVTKNPPLASYYLALVGHLVGWSEPALHAALVLPAAGVALGTYVLARGMTARPGEATLAAVLTPVVLVSSTSVMCDTPMLCVWVWALVCWTRGTDRHTPLLLALGALLASVAALTKYFGVALLPLFALYALLRDRRSWTWVLWLVLPAAILAAYQLWTQRVYGRGLLLDAMGYASAVRARSGTGALPRLLTGLAFTGGCAAPVLFYAPALWSRRALLGVLAATACLAALLAVVGKLGLHPLQDDTGIRWSEIVQIALATTLGASVVALAALDLWSERSAEAALLAAWALGTLVFAVGLNWTVNARTLLPLAPPFGILVTRRLDRRQATAAIASGRTRWLLVPAAVLAVLVATADLGLAVASRDAARSLGAQLSGTGRTVWFEGHWGFQYYAQLGGLLPLDYRRPAVRPGDLLIAPEIMSDPYRLPENIVAPLREFTFQSFPFLTTQSDALGAGFYATVFGPLPFAFGRVPPERYMVLEFVSGR